MKSDEEFIAGIYEKAEERRREAGEPAEGRKQTLQFRPHIRRRLTAAACICILGCAALAAAAAGRSRTENEPEPYADYALLPASLDGEDNSRSRSVEQLRTFRGMVTACRTEETAAVLEMTDAETGKEILVVLQCGVKPEAGEEVILILNEEQDGYYLTDASRYYWKGSGGLYCNAQGSVFSEDAEGE